MADTKISAMAASANLNATKFPVVDAGANKTGEVSSDTALTDNSDAKIPTQKAVKAYADTKAASSHGHAIGDVTNLQTALDGKSATTHNHDADYAALGHNHTGVYQPADAQLDSLAGLSFAGNANKVVRVNAGENGFEVTTPAAGGGDVVGNDTTVAVQNIVAYAHAGGKQVTELTGTGGDILYYDGGVSSWVKLPRGTFGQLLQMNAASTLPEWAYGGVIHYSKSAGATTTGANTTPVDVSGAVFTYVANAVYSILVIGRINSTAATTGVGIQFNVSTAITAIDNLAIHPLTTATPGISYSIADDTSAGVSTGVPAGPLDVPVVVNALLVPGANTGTCQLRLRSETTAVTELMAGTVMIVWRIA